MPPLEEVIKNLHALTRSPLILLTLIIEVLPKPLAPFESPSKHLVYSCIIRSTDRDRYYQTIVQNHSNAA